MDKLLNDILSIHSCSGEEFEQQQFILDYVRKDLKLCYEYDFMGNIFIFPTGKKDEVMPCIVAHMDTVHKTFSNKKVITEVEVKKPYTTTDEIEYEDRTEFIKTVFKGGKEIRISSPTGIGGDDKCGIYAALKLIEDYNVKILFTVQEEVGGLGAKEVSFDINPSYFLEIDRKGSSDIVVESRTTLADGEFRVKLEQIGVEFGFKISEGGSFTDVDALHDYDVQACNISAGYYNAHQKTEYIVFEELQNTIAFCRDFVTRVTEIQKGPSEKKNQGLYEAYGVSIDHTDDCGEYIRCECGNDNFSMEEKAYQCCFDCGAQLIGEEEYKEAMGIEAVYCPECLEEMFPDLSLTSESSLCGACGEEIAEFDMLTESECIKAGNEREDAYHLANEKKVEELERKERETILEKENLRFRIGKDGKLIIPLKAYGDRKVMEAYMGIKTGEQIKAFSELSKKQKKYILGNYVEIIN